jgi:hypothetical protein
MLSSLYKGKVVVNDINYDILGAHTDSNDITNQFRIYCAMNDIIFLDELIKTMPNEFRGCNFLRIFVKSQDESKQIEIDIYKGIYTGKIPKKITQNQIIFDF